MELQAIGKVSQQEGKTTLVLKEEVKDALLGLGDFSHVMVLYWFDQLDVPELRAERVVEKPYKKGPEKLGIFATRGPVRPNPIAVSVAGILSVDEEAGIVELDYLDAEVGSPLLDLKPYTPSAEIVQEYQSPDWCAHWPQSYEESGEFDWSKEFNFEA
ncbi:SAM-dependent methyltransferase [Enterococcus sp. AZ109]|uniref:SAM-dependent methyltransferase n=1 Tax=Enterococcus sp. AZ109 TaxID=2774634 RepID=UPI003F1F11C6